MKQEKPLKNSTLKASQQDFVGLSPFRFLLRSVPRKRG